MIHATLNDWIRSEAISFSVDSPETFNASIDRVMASLGDLVELLGFGEALHGGYRNDPIPHKVLRIPTFRAVG
jgi:hypothetical protein